MILNHNQLLIIKLLLKNNNLNYHLLEDKLHYLLIQKEIIYYIKKHYLN